MLEFIVGLFAVLFTIVLIVMVLTLPAWLLMFVWNFFAGFTALPEVSFWIAFAMWFVLAWILNCFKPIIKINNFIKK